MSSERTRTGVTSSGAAKLRSRDGNRRTRTLLALVFLIAACWPPAVYALPNDYGPTAAVAAIRHDLPILLGGLKDEGLTSIVDWVVTDGTEAVALWHAGKRHGVVVLRWELARWWWRAGDTYELGAELWTPMEVPGNGIEGCNVDLGGPPSAHDLLAQGFISRTLAEQLSGRLRARPTSGPAYYECMPSSNYISIYEGDGFDAGLFHEDDTAYTWSFTLKRSKLAEDQQIADGTSLFLFLLSAQLKPRDYSPLPNSTWPPSGATFSRGATLDVWFPYVLPIRKHYTVRLSGVVPEIADTPGMLRHNVLYFKLPPFTLEKGAVADGEIDATDP